MIAIAAALVLAATLRVPSEPYPTIQSAINGAGQDDVILVAKGTYVEHLTVSGNNAFTLRGLGNPVLDGDGGTCIDLQSASNVSISGFVLRNADEGVRLSQSQFVTLSRITVVDPAVRGFHFLNGSHDVTVSKCSVSGSGEEGLLDEESDGLVVSKCRFTGTGKASVALSPNYFTDSSAGSDGAVVEKCVITASNGVGIHWGGNNVLLSRNRITGADSIGIFTDANVATTGSTVEKNKVTDAGDEGICIGGSSNSVTKNSITGAMGNGIQVEGTENVIGGNRIRTVNLTGIFVTGTGGHALAGNSVVGADQYGILVQSSVTILTGNRASGNGLFDLYDEFPEGTNSYEGNRFKTTFFGPV